MNKSFAAEEYKDLLQDEIRIFLNNPQYKIMEELLNGFWDEVLLDLLMGEAAANQDRHLRTWFTHVRSSLH